MTAAILPKLHHPSWILIAGDWTNNNTILSWPWYSTVFTGIFPPLSPLRIIRTYLHSWKLSSSLPPKSISTNQFPSTPSHHSPYPNPSISSFQVAGTEVGCNVCPRTKLMPLVKSPVEAPAPRGLRERSSPSAKMPRMFLSATMAGCRAKMTRQFWSCICVCMSHM